MKRMFVAVIGASVALTAGATDMSTYLDCKAWVFTAANTSKYQVETSTTDADKQLFERRRLFFMRVYSAISEKAEALPGYNQQAFMKGLEQAVKANYELLKKMNNAAYDKKIGQCVHVSGISRSEYPR